MLNRFVIGVVLFITTAGHSNQGRHVLYYANIDLSSPEALRSSLHEIIDDHTQLPYTSSSTDTWDVLEQADENPNNPNTILDVYKNALYPKTGGGQGPYNREHVWPKSFGFPRAGRRNIPYTDCHHLHLSDTHYNNARGNRIFGPCPGSCAEYPTQANVGNGGPGIANRGRGQGTRGRWEVWEGRRGDIARTMFYLDVRYEGGFHRPTGYREPQLVLTDDVSLIVTSSRNKSIAHMGLLAALLRWHKEDPVDDMERVRNEVVFSHQGNRNPFIDHPEFVAFIYEQ